MRTRKSDMMYDTRSGEILSQNIYRLMKEQGKTFDYGLPNVTSRTLYRIMAGHNTTLSTIDNIAAGLKVSAFDLLRDTGP